jgi:hypothetical protein
LLVWRLLDTWEAPADQRTGQRKIVSSVFRTEEMSVYLSDQVTLSQVIAQNKGCFVAELTVGTIRQERCIIARDPNDPAHGLVYNENDPGDRRISSGQAKRMRDCARLIIP